MLIGLIILSIVFFLLTFMVARKNITFMASNRKVLKTSDGVIEASAMGSLIAVVGLVLHEGLGGLTVGMLISLGMTAAVILFVSVIYVIIPKGE